MAFAAALWTALPRRIPDVEERLRPVRATDQFFQPSSLLNEEG